ncbi:hypothetical protein [Chlamydia vaughanii]|uniref:hypothetical protein n=1 Tax=Chlamydia vaughanii TaxID=3112552 RepID=UPI0032B0F357
MANIIQNQQAERSNELLTSEAIIERRLKCVECSRVFGIVLGAIVSIILLVVGATGAAGVASLPLIIIGSVFLGCCILSSIMEICRKRKRQEELRQEELRELPLIRPELPPVAEQALAYARNRLAGEEVQVPEDFWGGLRSPENPEISRISALLGNKIQETHQYIVDQESNYYVYPRNPESWTLVCPIMTEYMQLAFAESYLTLLDIPALRSSYPQDYTSNLLTLYRQNSYAYNAFYRISSAYHRMRFLYQSGLEDDDEAQQAAVARFYQEGTPEYQWRMLFNSFCEQARCWIGDLAVAEETEIRLVKHSRADLAIDHRHPGTIPT